MLTGTNDYVWLIWGLDVMSVDSHVATTNEDVNLSSFIDESGGPSVPSLLHGKKVLSLIGHNNKINCLESSNLHCKKVSEETLQHPIQKVNKTILINGYAPCYIVQSLVGVVNNYVDGMTDKHTYVQ